MAFTGKKIKGSEVFTEQTMKYREEFHKLMSEIKQNDPEEYAIVKEQMFWSMFEHLSHTHEKRFVEWARNIEYRTFFSKAE